VAQKQLPRTLRRPGNNDAGVGREPGFRRKMPENHAELRTNATNSMASIAELEDGSTELPALTEEVKGRLDGAHGEIRAGAGLG